MKKTNDAMTSLVPDQANSSAFFGSNTWLKIMNADAGISFLDADVQLYALHNTVPSNSVTLSGLRQFMNFILKKP